MGQNVGGRGDRGGHRPGFSLELGQKLGAEPDTERLPAIEPEGKGPLFAVGPRPRKQARTQDLMRSLEHGFGMFLVEEACEHLTGLELGRALQQPDPESPHHRSPVYYNPVILRHIKPGHLRVGPAGLTIRGSRTIPAGTERPGEGRRRPPARR